VVLGEPTARTVWAAERAVPRVGGELDVLDAMTAAEVRDWVAEHGGRPEPARPAARVA
jgi:hypothetical protein